VVSSFSFALLILAMSLCAISTDFPEGPDFFFRHPHPGEGRINEHGMNWDALRNLPALTHPFQLIQKDLPIMDRSMGEGPLSIDVP
jgi:hypothetical protein